MTDLAGCVITNIRRGKVDPKRPHTRGRDKVIYAELRSATGELLISADVDYIANALHERIPVVQDGEEAQRT
jgi:hypothetical protein